jgi:CheY-like chemotaxis protein
MRRGSEQQPDGNRQPWHDSELQFRSLLEVLPAGAYSCDAAGLITYFNQHAVQLWGRAPKLNDPVDRFCGSFKLYSPDGSPIAHDQCGMALALQTGRPQVGQEIVIERPDGSRLTALAHANPIRNEAGEVVGAVNVLVDISDRRQDEFLATLAHELRNTLAPICNSLHLLRLSDDLPPAVRHVREIMERQVNHMVRLVDDLLELARITQGPIDADSGGAGRGSEFVVSLPLALSVSSVNLPSEAARHAAIATQPRRILVVDDTESSAYILGKLLESMCQHVTTADDAQAALKLARAQHPHVVISDIAMPGMDGCELARRLRSEPGLENVVLVAMTGYGQDNVRQRAQDAGFDYYLVKPASVEKLEDLLASLPPLPKPDLQRLGKSV